MTAARALLSAAMRAALSRLSHRAASSSSCSSAAAAADAAQAAAASLPSEARRSLSDPSCPLALGVVTDGGRALVARRPISQGEVLLSEWPLAAAPRPQSGGGSGGGGDARQCHHCLRLLAPGQGLPASAPAREAAIPEEEEEAAEARTQEWGDRRLGETGDATTATPAAAATDVAAAPPRARDPTRVPRRGAPPAAAASASPGPPETSFCGDACARAAETSYHRVERRADFFELRAHCARAAERFPLVAARLACAALQAWEAGGREQELARARAAAGDGAAGAPAPLRRRSWLPLRAVSAPAATTAATATAAPPEAATAGAGRRDDEKQPGAEDAAFVDAVAADAAASRLGPMASVSRLCRASLPSPAGGGGAAPGSNSALLLPAAWARSHALLVRALGAMLDAEPPGSAARLLPCARAVSSPEWYAGVLSRLHLNSFRVESAATAPLLAAAAAAAPGGGEGAAGGADFSAALLRAASAGPAGPSALGSAVYGAASLANHSCDPTADAAWPAGDARLRLTARRDLAQGEQVTIAYIDCALGVEERRAFLEHAYGFACLCARCVEELGDLPPDMPPLPR